MGNKTGWKLLTNNKNNNMAKIDSFKPVNKNNQAEVIDFLMAYKKQAPAKFEQKKAELFKKFGLSLEDEAKIEPVKDATDIQLEALKAKAKK